MGNRWLWLAGGLTILLLSCPAGAGERPVTGAPAPAPDGAAAPAEESGDGAARISKNFLVLMGNSWKDIGKFVLRLLLGAVLWGLLLLFVGGVLGFLLYRFLRKRELFAAPFKWYRYVRWLWVPVFVISVCLGCGYAGLWLGGGRALKGSIREDRILDRVIANAMVAVFLDSADYALTGETTVEEIKTVLADSEKVGKLARKDLAETLKQLAEESEDSAAQRRLLELAGDSAVEAAADEALREMDPRLVFIVFACNENIDEYLKQYPDANIAVAALSVHFETVREKACSSVNAVVYSNVLLGAGIGLGIPLALLGLFRLALWLYRRKKGGDDGEPVAEAG